MNKFIRKVSPEQYEEDSKEVLELFYRTELRPGEDIIDNTDGYISKELNIPIAYVSRIINSHLDEKYSDIKERINLDKSPLSYNQLRLENEFIRQELKRVKKQKQILQDKNKKYLKKINKVKTKDQIIDKACEMIKQGKRTKEIVNELNFKYPINFYRAFEKIKGITISEYKNELSI